MAREPSRFQRIRNAAQALWDESALGPHAHLTRMQKFAHFWILVGKSFSRNRCPVRASALAYATLLALIPMLAVVVSVTSPFLKKQGEEQIDRFIVKMVASIAGPATVNTNTLQSVTNSVPLENTNAVSVAGTDTNSTTNKTDWTALANDTRTIQARKEMVGYIHQFIQNTQSGALGVTGTVALIFVAISMLARIEDTMNDIWGVARGRGWFTRVAVYWLVISLAPVLLAVAVGLATGPHLSGTKKLLVSMPFAGNLIFELLPIVVLCLTFALFYMLMPNAKVDWRAALVGGAVGGVLWHVNNSISALYVSRVVSNSRIYGSLGLVPVFMIGLYFSWLILLFGAQVAYAFQNRVSYMEEKQVEQINQRGREFVALRLMASLGERFLCGEPPATTADFAGQLCVPSRLIRQIMHTLGAARLIAEIAGSETAYLPARPLEKINCHDILLAMRATHGQELATRDEPSRREVYGEFHRIEEAERQAASAVTLLDLVQRSQAKQIGMTE
jgi:membrane protein